MPLGKECNALRKALCCRPKQSREVKRMPASNNRALRIAAAVAGLFFLLIVVIVYLAAKEVITPQMAMLMFVMLLGMYVGFGVLIAVYRFMNKLQ